MSNKKHKQNDNLIAVNKKARHDYHIQERFEAGLVLQGWEVKSIRAARVQLKDSYVVMKQGEAWIIGMHISPLMTASTHILPDPLRSRKLLLQKKELQTLIGAVQRKGFTLTTLSLYWKKNRVKVEIGLAKGKKDYDKRESLRQRDWEREKQRAMKIR
jgi:SsrA-binding protein